VVEKTVGVEPSNPRQFKHWRQPMTNIGSPYLPSGQFLKN